MSKANPRFRRVNVPLPAPTNDVYRARFVGSIEGQLTIDTFYYRGDSAAGTESLAMQINLVTALELAGGMRDKYKACMSSDWTMESMLIDCPFIATLATLTAASVGPGTGPAGHEPTTVATVISRFSKQKGQCGRGHVSLPAVPTAWVTSSMITSSTAYDAFVLTMGGVISGGGHNFTPVIYSKGTRVSPKASGISDQINATLRDVLGTVRRRKLGRGK